MSMVLKLLGDRDGMPRKALASLAALLETTVSFTSATAGVSTLSSVKLCPSSLKRARREPVPNM